MPRATRHPVDSEYAKLRTESLQAMERGDCAVVAVAAATGRPYAEVRERLRQMGRKNRRGTFCEIYIAALKSFGYSVKAVHPSFFIGRYYAPGRVTSLQHVTTHHPDRFPKVWTDGRTYLFRTPGHVLCVKNGRNLDWTRGSAKRVNQVLQVFPTDRPQDAIPDRKYWTFSVYYYKEGSVFSVRGNRSYPSSTDAAAARDRVKATLAERGLEISHDSVHEVY